MISSDKNKTNKPIVILRKTLFILRFTCVLFALLAFNYVFGIVDWHVHFIFFQNIERIKYLTMTDAKKVWMPDTFFRNEKEGRFHNILVPNVYIRIFPNGDVLYSIR